MTSNRIDPADGVVPGATPATGGSAAAAPAADASAAATPAISAPTATSAPSTTSAPTTTLPSTAAAPAVACNICGCTTFKPGPGDRLSVTKRLPVCTKCGALERHRVFRSMFNAFRTVKFKSLSALMFSMDPSVAGGWFASMRYSVYGTESSLDVQKIDLPDGAVDVVICNHVLEHVPRYEDGLREICRIITPEGFAFISFPNPHNRVATVDWGFPKPEMHGHYRIFGSDVEDKLPRLLPGIGILRLFGEDPVTGVADRAYVLSKNADFLETITLRGLPYFYLRA